MTTTPRTRARSKTGDDRARRAPSGSLNRRERAYTHLRSEIVEGRLRPGEPLTEVELSKRIGVSRTPVREALLRLAVEGLVTWVPGRGAFVNALTVPDILQLWQLREALETYAARLAARSEERASMERFLELLAAARGQIKAGDIGSYNRLTDALDRSVGDLTGNDRLQAALREVWAQSRRVRRMANQNATRITATIDEHARIVRAIVAGKEDEAAAAVSDHLRGSLTNVIESLAGGSLRSAG